ncbi:MAG: hypothetical protein AB7F41_11715 [Methylocystis sp.]|uniref:glucosamine inositolphosphorylceramide transferase family protein n=1 Tax=Methylocystis sp. TaxID=1911079 RepID=UPI003D124B8B
MNLRRIHIVVPRNRFLRWHQRLRDRLQRVVPNTQAALRFENAGEAWPEGVAPLLSLEHLLLRRSRTALADALDPRAEAEATRAPADIAIDLAGEAQVGGARVLRLRYDGEISDRHAIASLLAGRAPTIAVEDAATGAILAQGLPSLEAADGLTGGLDAVYSRATTLIEQALTTPAPAFSPPAPRAPRAPKSPAAFAARSIAFETARKIYHLCCQAPHWRVGWRFTDGPGVLETGSLQGAPWRPMQDRELNFAADPFPCAWRGVDGVFYEHLDHRRGIGEIYFQRFDDDGPCGAPVQALEEPWHLSYPFLIEHDDQLYMMPEASTSGAISLYRCVEFPHRWEKAARLLDDIEAADATIFRHEGRFWMTSVVRNGVGGYSDTLALHYAHDLFGPWRPHAHQPALVDSRFARPAGEIAHVDGELLRPVQDCSQGYGKRLVIMRIDELTPQTFRQTPLKVIEADARWPGSRLHTINRTGRIECIDGVVIAPRFLPLRRLTHRLLDARAARAARETPSS